MMSFAGAADQDVVAAGAGESCRRHRRRSRGRCRRRRQSRRRRGNAKPLGGDAAVDGELQRLAAGVAGDIDVVGEHRQRARHLGAVGDLDLDDDAVAAAALDGGVRRLRAEPGLARPNRDSRPARRGSRWRSYWLSPRSFTLAKVAIQPAAKAESGFAAINALMASRLLR